MRKTILMTFLIIISILSQVRAEITINGEERDHTFNIYKYYPEEQQVLPETTIYSEILIKPLVLESEVSVCKEAEYSFLVYNPTVSIQRYTFVLDDFKGSAVMPTEVTLDSGMSETIYVDLTPDCSLTGRVNPSIILESRNEKAIVPLVLDIAGYEGFDLTYDKDVFLCNVVETRKTINIENYESFENEYEILVDKEWISVEPGNKIILDGNSRGSFDILLKPDYKTYARSTVNIDIVPKYGEKANYKLYLETDNCYSQEIFLTKKSYCENEKTLFFTLKNTGKYTEDFLVTVSNEDIEMNLESQESIDIPVDITELGSGKHELNIRSEIKNNPAFTKEEAIIISISELDECYVPEVLTDSIFVLQSTQKEVIEIKNVGLGEDTFDFKLISPEFVELSDDFLEFDKNGIRSLELQLDLEFVEEGRYPVLIVATSQNTGVEYRKEIMMRVSSMTVFDKILKNKCVIAGSVLGLILAILFIKLLLDLSSSKRKAFIDILAILVIFILFMGLSNLCFDSFMQKTGLKIKNNVNETSNNCLNHFDEEICESNFYIRMKEDKTTEYDLKDMFYDPDGDTLEYYSEKSLDFDVNIVRGIARITPVDDFYGTSEIIFGAKDEKGGYAESRRFYLHVIDEEEFYMEDFIIENHLSISIFLILILVLIIGFLFYKITDLPPEKKEETKKETHQETTIPIPDEKVKEEKPKKRSRKKSSE